jgi:hypothetical protein
VRGRGAQQSPNEGRRASSKHTDDGPRGTNYNKQITTIRHVYLVRSEILELCICAIFLRSWYSGHAEILVISSLVYFI